MRDVLALAVRRGEEHQVPLYLLAIAVGAAVGLAAPGLAPGFEHAIEPALVLLLFATFLAVPLAEVGRSLRDVRFLLTVLAANFLVVPVLAAALSRFVADDDGLVLGLLLVLLTPCIDYVIVFTGLAGGARGRLLAAAPLLMLLQLLLLPVSLWVIAGPEVVGVIDPGPFAEAFLLLIALPLAAAGMVQGLGRRHRTARAARAVEGVMAGAMVPFMMLTLLTVVGSQIGAVGSEPASLARLLPLYAAFVVLAVLVGLLAARLARLDVPSARAVVFSVATRNSLVVLPLALALPPAFALAPLAVVTQTLVELVAMVVMVRLVPVLLPERAAG